MYEFIWRHLPGPTWFRVIEALALTVLVVLGLFEFVFPWANVQGLMLLGGEVLHQSDRRKATAWYSEKRRASSSS